MSTSALTRGGRRKKNEKEQMAAKEGSAPSLRVSKALVLLLHHSAISVARLSELSSVRPLCHTDQPPRKSASHMKGGFTCPRFLSAYPL